MPAALPSAAAVDPQADLAVAESYDAMTSERPYRPAKEPSEAIAEMGRYSGSQFDGAVVDALVRALDRAAAGSAV